MNMLVAGEWVGAKKKIDVVNPFNGKVIDSVPAASVADVKRAIAQASEYDFGLTAADRYEILHTLCHLLKDSEEEIVRLISMESGKPLKESRIEFERGYQTFLFSAEEAKRINGEILPVDAIGGMPRQLGLVLRESLGVVVAITPFNYPLNLVAHKIGPAIASNNPVVLKPSSRTPLTALRVAELLMRAGLPGKMLHVVTGISEEISDALVLDPDVKCVTFTGSVKAGKALCAKIGMKKVSMELGGNCPLIVLEDADMKEAVSCAVKGAFGNNGQRCTSTKRIIIHRAVADNFIESFVREALSLRMGDQMDPSTDIGPLISEKALTAVDAAVKKAVAGGASLVCGGRRNGPIYPPTVLDRMSRSNPVSSEEVFGPVASFFRAGDFDEAIDLANSTTYGLQAGIFTNDLKKAREAIKRIDAGGVMINNAPGFRAEHLPFGGVKDSGIGREGVKYAIAEMTRLKTVVW